MKNRHRHLPLHQRLALNSAAVTWRVVRVEQTVPPFWPRVHAWLLREGNQFLWAWLPTLERLRHLL